jgi:hypothetical protein
MSFPNAQNEATAAIPVWIAGLRAAPAGYEQIASLATATGLTVPTGATMAVIRASGANVRYRDDGTAPTADLGMPLLTTDPPLLYASALAALSFIQETDSAVLDVLYYR